MITIIYQFKHNVTWHCRINQFFSFPEQLQIWIYVFLVGDHRYAKEQLTEYRLIEPCGTLVVTSTKLELQLLYTNLLFSVQ